MLHHSRFRLLCSSLLFVCHFILSPGGFAVFTTASAAVAPAPLPTAQPEERFNVTVCCIGVASRAEVFSIAYFAAAAGWWQGRPTLGLDTTFHLNAPPPTIIANTSAAARRREPYVRMSRDRRRRGAGNELRGAWEQQQQGNATNATSLPNLTARNPFDDASVGLGVGWPRLKVVGVRPVTIGGSAVARDMLRTYTLLNADAECNLLVGPALSYVAIPLAAIVERPLWVDFAAERTGLVNLSAYTRVNLNLDDFTRVVIGILQSLERALAIRIPSVTILASTDAYSDELTASLLARLAAVGIEVEFTVMLPLDATRQQAQDALAQLRTARSRIVIPTVQMSHIVSVWVYFGDAASAALAAEQYDFIFVFASGGCGVPPLLPGLICGLARLNSTQTSAFGAARDRQPRAFADDISRRLRAMNQPDISIPALVELGSLALIIDAVTFGLGAINAFVTQNNRLPRTTGEIRAFAVQGSTTNTIDGPAGYVMPGGLSGTVHLAPDGNRLGLTVQILNYQSNSITEIGLFDFENGTIDIRRDTLYLRGGYYTRPLRSPPEGSSNGEGGRATNALIPAVVSAVGGAALIAAFAVGCCWWRRRWPSREVKLARRNKWAVRGLAGGGDPTAVLVPTPPHLRGDRHSRRKSGTRGDSNAVLVAPPMLAPTGFPPSALTAAATVVWIDIERSTALWAQLPRAMGRAIDAYHALVRTLIWAHHGYETRTAGDAFMVVFGNAADAVEFAMVLQLALVNDVPWAAVVASSAADLAGAAPAATGSGSASAAAAKYFDLLSRLESVTLKDGGLAPENTASLSAAERSGHDDPFDHFYRTASDSSSNPSSSLAANPLHVPASTAAGPNVRRGASAVDPRRRRQQQQQNQGPLWGGLRVRTGMATGIVAVNTDPLTGAFDYAGPPVDTSARVCLLSRGGQTVMTERTLCAALAHADLDPGHAPPAVAPQVVPAPAAPNAGQPSQQDVHASRHYSKRSHFSEPPVLRMGWLRPSESIGSQVPKLSKTLSDPSVFALKLTFGVGPTTSSSAEDLRILTPPRDGRAAPYVRPSGANSESARSPRGQTSMASHLFPSSTHVLPLGVYGMDVLHGSVPRAAAANELRRSGDATKGGRRGVSGERGKSRKGPIGQISYQSLYQALPSQLAGRKFAALRTKLLPGLVKYRNADGRLSDHRPRAASDLHRAPSPHHAGAVASVSPQPTQGAGGVSAEPDVPGASFPVEEPAGAEDTKKPVGRRGVAVKHVSILLAKQEQVASPVQCPQDDDLDQARFPATAAARQVPLDPHGADRAMTVLIQVLLAPLSPQVRQEAMGEISAGWRLPPLLPATNVQARGAAGESRVPTASDVAAVGAETDAMAQDALGRLAQRCAAVYLSSLQLSP